MPIWRTVRLFISSTFRDMHAERDHLVKVVFPKLRQWCDQHRLHLIDVDLRWGVTEVEADNGKALDICLAEIDGSRPFFVCFLGGRYGWVPEPLPAEERYRFRALPDVMHRSITHLEILHAAGQPIPSVEGRCGEVCDQAFFYLRDDACIPPAAALLKLSEAQRQRHASTYFEQDRPQELGDLRRWVRSRFEDAGRVREYSGTWDAAAANPEEDSLQETGHRLVGRLTDLEGLGELVFADLRRGIELQFAEHIRTARQPIDPRTAERAWHEAFIENRTRVHVPRRDIERQLLAYCRGDDGRPLALTGPPGSGKSAILAHWIRENVDPDTWLARWDNKTFVVPRFIGAGPSSTVLPRLLAGICEELVARFDLQEKIEIDGPDGQKLSRTQTMEVPQDAGLLQAKWPEFLAAATARGPVLLLLDAINQLDRSADPLRLSWLPHKLPSGLRVIVSVLDHADRSEPVALDRPGADSADWLAVLRRRGTREEKVSALTSVEQNGIIVQLPSVFCKTLGPKHVHALVGNWATTNPLFLIVALEELRVFGGYRTLEEKIDHLPRLAPPAPGGQTASRTIDDALDELFGQVLDRLDREASQRGVGALVPTLFRLLASARDGLSEREMQELLARSLPRLDEKRRDGEMQIVLRQVRGSLLRKGPLLDFYHRSFWKAVRKKYLQTPGDRVAAHRALADYFADEEAQPFWLAQERGRRANDRKAAELLWQRLALVRETASTPAADDALQDVVDLVSNLAFLEAKAEAGMLNELLEDLAAVQRCLGEDHPAKAALRVVGQVIGDEVRFLTRHPGALFQCLWNRCWWQERLEAARLEALRDDSKPDEEQEPTSPRPDHWRLEPLLERWRAEKEHAHPGFRWFRALLPPDEEDFSRLYRQVNVLVGQKVSVGCLSYSRDGKRIYSGGSNIGDGVIHAWDAATGQELMQFTGHQNGIGCLAVAPDDAWLASGSRDGTVRLWHPHAGVELVCLEARQGEITCLAASPDGRWLASGSEEGTVRLWEGPTWRERLSLRGQGKVTALQITADAWILTGDEGGTIRVHDVLTGGELGRYPGFGARKKILAFTPDGRLAAVETRDEIRVVRIESGESVARLSGTMGSDFWSYAAFSAAGDRLAGGTSHGHVVFCDLVTEGSATAGTHPGGSIQSVAFSPDGSRIASGSLIDPTVRVWHVGPPPPPDDAEDLDSLAARKAYLERMLDMMSESVLRARRAADTSGVSRRPRRFHSFSPDGRWFVTSGRENTIQPDVVTLWSAPECSALAGMKGHELHVEDVQVSSDGRFVTSGGVDQTLRVWDVAHQLPVHCFGGDAIAVADAFAELNRFGGGWRGPRDYGIGCFALAADGRGLLCGLGQGHLILWDLEDGREVHRLCEGGSTLRSVAFSPDARLAGGAFADGAVVVWDVADGRETARMQTGAEATCICFAPNAGCVAVGTANGEVYVWDGKGTVLAIFRGFEGRWTVKRLEFSPDSRSVVAVSDYSGVGVGEIGSGRWTALEGKVDPAWIARGRSAWRVRARDGEIVLESASTGEELAWYPWGDYGPESVVMNPADERVLAVCETFDARLLYLEGKLPGRQHDALADLPDSELPLVTPVRNYDVLARRWEPRLSATCPWCGRRFEPADSGPVSRCPHCRQPMKFTPFVVDRRELLGQDHTQRLLQQEEERQLHGQERELRLAAQECITAGNYPQALHLLGQQEQMCRNLKKHSNLMNCLGQQARTFEAMGRLAHAAELHQKLIDLCRSSGDEGLLAHVLGSLSTLYYDTQRFAESLQLELEIEALQRRFDNPNGLAVCLGNQAVALRELGQLEAALQKHREEEQVCRALPDDEFRNERKKLVARSLGNQASVLLKLRCFAEALEAGRQEIALQRERNDLPDLVKALQNHALVVARATDRPEQGLPFAEEAGNIVRANGLADQEAHAQRVLSVLSQASPPVPSPPAAGYGGSAPHWAADPNREARLSMKYAQILREWQALPWWKRWLRWLVSGYPQRPTEP